MRSGRIDDLIEGGSPNERTISGQKAYTDRYGRFDPAFPGHHLLPDWPSDAAVLAQLYPQPGQAVDGVIAVDPTGLRRCSSSPSLCVPRASTSRSRPTTP
ncbi:DUF4012 domain-containing protein [Aquihabitans sp. G128]|uniref:DUF4012 domain-containing protein n=1 Tax=Aquihabitans sp. G128 TaxID=2849779 RepID=UPI001C22F295|nr:DUF4012 domain-containing protein [Aquihabitans sp. G128]QXC61271.1 DUF4012 domain-containing protein [Aquihabitans sp. G128]